MQKNTTIRFWAEDERPREKMILKGKNVLSDSEIIAILLGSGSRNKTAVELAQEILKNHQNDLNQLAKSSVKELTVYKGMGEAKAVTLIAALELGRRRKTTEQTERIKIKTAEDAFQLIKHLFQDLQHEEFYIILLDRSNHVIRYEQISKGGISGTVADGKIIFKLALLHHASAIILAHNHPSGNLIASVQDEKLTKDLKEFGNLIDIEILDHIIFTDYGYLSLAENSTTL